MVKRRVVTRSVVTVKHCCARAWQRKVAYSNGNAWCREASCRVVTYRNGSVRLRGVMQWQCYVAQIGAS